MSNSETGFATTEVIDDKHGTEIDRLSDRNTGTNEGMAPDTKAKAEQLSSSSARSPSGESGGKTPQSENDDLVRPGFTGIAGESLSSNKQDSLTKVQEELEARLAKEYGMDGLDLDSDGILQEAKNREDWDNVKKLHELYHTRTNLARPKKPRAEKGRATEEEIFSVARKSSKLPAASRFWALLIGINKYASQPLKGCINDGVLMKEYLTKDLRVPEDHVRFLYNESATRDNIINALLYFRTDTHICRGDIIIIYFAGHGSNYICSEHQEYAAQNPDRWLACCPVEEICPVDRGVRTYDFPKGIPDISDREMNVILKEISNAKGHRITVILDCCHAGGATRKPGDDTRGLPALSRDVHDDARRRQSPWHSQSATIPTIPSPWVDGWIPDLSSHVIIAGCKGHETAKERENEESGVINGVFTRALVGALRKSKSNGVQLTYSQLWNALPLQRLRYQTPVVAGKSKDKLLWSQED